MKKIVNRKINYLLGTIILLIILFGSLTLKNNLSTKEIKVYNHSNILAATESTTESTSAEYIYLSDYNWVSAKNGYGSGGVRKDEGQGGSYKLSLNVDGIKRQFKKGFSIHANGNVIYDISAYSTEYTHFVAQVGVDNSQGSKGSVRYTISLSNDNKTWEEKVKTGVLKGGNNAYKVNIDITGYKYIKIEVDNGGNGNGNDHGTIGEAKLVRKDIDPEVGPYSKLRPVEYYDNILKNNSVEENYNNKNNYNLVLKRELVRKLGYWTIQDIAVENQKVYKMLEWLTSSDTRLELAIEVGNISNSTKFMTTLADLYDEYGNCLSAENGDVYLKMMMGLAAGYSSDRASTPLTFGHITTNYNYIERYHIIKELYDNNMFLYGNGFKEYHVEFFRYLMNDSTRNDELKWMNYIGRAKKYSTGVYSYVAYIKPNYSKTAKPHLYDIANKDKYEKKYHLAEYGVPFADNTTRYWMVMEAGGICWNQARFAKSTIIGMGRPSLGVYQPGHESALFYTAANADGTGKGSWSIAGNISGWGKTSNAWGGGNRTRTIFNWAGKSFTYSNTSGPNSGDSSGYIYLAQANLNNYPVYKESLYYNLIANSYANNEDKLTAYNKALAVNGINLDSYDYKIQMYKALNKTSEEWHQLALDIIDNYTFYPMAMGDLIKLIKPYLNGVDRVDIDQRYYNALVRAKGATASDIWQATACKQIASARLGSASNKLATFSFDGENAGKIVLSKDYDTFTDLMWKYSLDGGATKSEGTLSHAFQLSEEEIAKINATDDIKLYIVGLNEANPTYTIDITVGQLDSNLYGNDWENRVIGLDNTYEWRNSEVEEWKSYEAMTPDNTGNKTLYVRKKATGNKLPSESKAFQFTQDTDTETRKYIPIEHLSVQGYSTQSLDSKRPYYAPNAIDGNRNTLWHTNFNENVITSKNKPYIIIKLDGRKCVSALEFVQTQYKANNPDYIKNMIVYVSDDNETWTEIGRKENCAKDQEFKAIEFEESMSAQYVKLEMDTYDMFASLAMVNLFEDTTKKIVASFSFDGENSEAISLYEEYKGLSWKYSIDGGSTWKNASGDSHTLTKEELNQITEENRIKIKFDNDENIYTLIIQKGKTPVISSTVYVNDLENRLIGMTNTSTLEWKCSDDETWTSYDEEEPRVTGNRTLQIRNKATGICTASDSVEYQFTEDNQSDTEKYISIKHLSIADKSSENVRSAKNEYEYAKNAIDGNVNTQWHTNRVATNDEKYIVIKLDSPKYISKIQYVKQAGYTYGVPKNGVISVSMDGENWEVAKTFENLYNPSNKNELLASENQKDIIIDQPKEALYVKIQSTASCDYVNKAGADYFIAATMLNLFEDSTKSIPTVELKYSTKKLTNQDVVVTLVEEATPITVTNNNGSNKHTFTKNGTFTFEFENANGKRGSVTANVDWIDKKAPVPTIAYNINEKTNQDVTATVMFDEENVTVEGGNTYTFTENGTYTFKFADSAGNKGTATAKVSWIAKQAPEAKIEYNITQSTSQNVTATIIFEDDDVMVTNGETTYTFTENGTYTFNFADGIGNEGTVTAEVTWIDKAIPTPTIEYDIKELTNKDVTATIEIDKSGVEVKGGKTHTFTENGEYIFEFEDEEGHKGSAVAKVDWIDKQAPTATIEYSAIHPINENIIATITFDEEDVIVEGERTYTFTDNGTYTFKFADKAGNTGTATANVNCIDRTLPKATITYNINQLTNQDVEATVTFDEQNVTVKGEPTHIFTENGEYEFEYTDASKNTGTVIARVDWIDKVVPNAIVSYDITDTTNQDVVATVTFDKDNVTVKDGNTYTFTENGEYIFEFEDAAGNKGTAVAMVSWIQKAAPNMEVTFNTKLLTNQDVEATFLFDKDVTILTDDLAIVKHDNNRYSMKFTANATVTVEFMDAEGNKGRKTIKVDWIDKVAPTATIEYSPTEETTESVVATLNSSEEVTITNNDGRNTYTFTENGEYIFEFEDKAGNKGTATAKVTWINKNNPDDDFIFKSDKYKIEDKFISKIRPGIDYENETTIKELKENLTTNQELRFLDKDGNVLEEDDVVVTGMILKVGENLEYTLVVEGDLDGDGNITINDIAKIKLHLIEKELLTLAETLKAADIDYDNEISINDLAVQKLLLIGLKTLE